MFSDFIFHHEKMIENLNYEIENHDGEIFLQQTCTCEEWLGILFPTSLDARADAFVNEV